MINILDSDFCILDSGFYINAEAWDETATVFVVGGCGCGLAAGDWVVGR